jgi:hypothetical protein
MKLIDTIRIPLSDVITEDDWRDGLDNTVVDGIARQVTEGRPINPIRVDDTYQLMQGRHRLAGHFHACANEIIAQVVQYDSEREREEDKLLENLCRRTLTPDERDRGLARLFDLAMEAAETANDATIPQSAAGSRQKKTKGEVASDIAAKTNQKQSAVERAVRKAHAPPEPAEPIVPKPPAMDKVLQRAHELLSEAQSVLEPIKKDIEAIREDFSKKDGRWALLGSVAQAANQARLGAEYVAHARTYLGDMERAKHMKGGNKRPVGAFEVAKGQDSYQESLRPRKADPEAMAQGEQHRHNFEQDEARGRKESLRLAEESKAQRIASGGGLKVPKRKLDVRISDGAGGEVPMAAVEETVNAWADAAKVGVGPSEDDDAAF